MLKKLADMPAHVTVHICKLVEGKKIQIATDRGHSISDKIQSIMLQGCSILTSPGCLAVLGNTFLQGGSRMAQAANRLVLFLDSLVSLTA
jgi:hypothetical protein